RVHRGLNALHLLHVTEDLDAILFAQNLFRDRSSGNAANGFPRASPAATGPCPDAELRLVSVVRVRWPELCLHFSVGFRPGVFVAHPHADRRAEGLTFKRARKNLHSIAFFARAHNPRLARAASIQVWLDVRLAESQPRRAAIDDDADACAVRFAPRRHSEQ